MLVMREHAAQKIAKRRRVDETLDARLQRRSAGDEPESPGEQVAGQRKGIDAEDRLDAQVLPKSGKLRDGLGERGLARGEEERIDRARRNAGNDVESSVRKVSSHRAEHADLIRGACAAPGENDGETSRCLRTEQGSVQTTWSAVSRWRRPSCLRTTLADVSPGSMRTTDDW